MKKFYLVAFFAAFLAGCVDHPRLFPPQPTPLTTASVLSSQILTPQPALLQAKTNFTVAWNYGDDSNIVFNFYSTTNLSQPLPWPLYETIAGTNRTATFPMAAPQRFFVITASNTVFGIESSFAN